MVKREIVQQLAVDQASFAAQVSKPGVVCQPGKS